MRKAIAIVVWAAVAVSAGMAGSGAGADELVATQAAVAPPPAATTAPTVGPETGLPLPRYVSLKTSRGRARRGPSDTHRVDWIYTLRDLPLRVTGEFEHWRRVEDSEGEGGWIHYSLLSGVRTVLVTQDMTPLRALPQPGATELAYLEAGVVARIMECSSGWCRVSVEGSRGWLETSAVWGVEPGEELR
ncbi:SH3 domain-containing protein [Pararhodobacter sp.]|uniref:SH3 domain-containing protein n=1 Tax=Pararhodobacter sp. TaxID=2127056 RepID=UPI002AFE3530|nr:SH3 domain-containing protein [Pararhodobacter sp.]